MGRLLEEGEESIVVCDELVHDMRTQYEPERDRGDVILCSWDRQVILGYSIKFIRCVVPHNFTGAFCGFAVIPT